MSRKNGEQGTSRPAWYEAGLAHVWLPYAQMKTVRAPLPVARTHGCRIVLCDGRELIDGIASWWTACHGYNHPHIRKAIEDQLALMPHIMFGGLAHEQALTLARRPAARIPGDLTRVFFSESGSVAVEIAMKMAVQFWLNQGVGKRKTFLDFKGGYHGDTTGAMAVCDSEDGMHARLRATKFSTPSGPTIRPARSCTGRPSWETRSPAPPPMPRSTFSSASRACGKSPISRPPSSRALRLAAAFQASRTCG